MSLPAMTLRDCGSRKGGTGEVGGCHLQSDSTRLYLLLAIERLQSAPGGPFLSYLA